MRIVVLTCLVFSVNSLNLAAFNIECEIKLATWPVLGGISSCWTKNMNITAQNQRVSSVNEQSAVEFKKQDIKGFIVHSQSVTYIPKELELYFPNIKGISIYNSRLKSVSKADFEPFPKLKVIQFNTNILESLSSDLFTYNLELRHINVKNNKLVAVGENIFEKLTKLEQIYLTNNTCIDKNAGSSVEIPALIAELIEKCPLIPEITTVKTLETTTVNSRLCNEKLDELQNMTETNGTEIDKLRSELSAIKTSSKNKIEDLENQLNTEKAKNAELNSKLTSVKSALEEGIAINQKLTQKFRSCELKLKSCDENFDSALENLFKVLNQELIPQNQRVDLICELIAERTCEAVELKVKFPNSLIGKVSDRNKTIIASDKITKLMINEQPSLFMPNRLAQLFPQLIELSVTDSGLYEINLQTFDGLGKLQTLTLSYNKIMKIPAKSFMTSENILKLDLSFNKITTINESAFKGLAQLQKLILNDNFLTKISRKVFDELANLKSLFLQNNKLMFIASNLFLQLPQIASVDFRDNECINVTFPETSKEHLSKTIIDDCTAPLEINCEFADDETPLQEKQDPVGYVCKVQDLTIETPNLKVAKVFGEHIDGLNNENVTAFIAVDQSIRFMASELVKHFPNIDKIVIERSKLSLIAKNDFEQLTNLKSIYLHHNDVTSIEAGTFDTVQLLEYINLAHNNISSLPSMIFVKLVKLKVLILSNNKLTSLSADILPSKSSIVDFKVNNNLLTIINPKVMTSLITAKRIDMRNNVCINDAMDDAEETGTTYIDLLTKVIEHCF